MQLKDLTPPIVAKLANRLRQDRKLYDSYESALAACKGGYEDHELVNVVREKTRLYRASLLSQHPFVSEIKSLHAVVGLSLAIRGNELSVIDFGGACGTHYFLSRAVFGEGIKLRWHVVETPKMVSEAIEFEDGQLRFFDTVQEARSGLGDIDLVFSSAALQYVPAPYESLERLIECGAEKMFLTRVGLSTIGRELIAVQRSRLSANGPGPMPTGMSEAVVRYPVTLVRKDRVEEMLSESYSIDIVFNEERGAYVAAKHSIDMHGYFAVRS